MEKSKNESVEQKIEPKNSAKKEPEIVFSVLVTENGNVFVTENGKPVANVQKVEFYADNKTAPSYTITKGIVPTQK